MNVRASPSAAALAELADRESAAARRMDAIAMTSPTTPTEAHTISARRGWRICHLPRDTRYAESGHAIRPASNGPTTVQTISDLGETAVT
ncbi:hypothetical protein [Brachybacterium sp. GPGPB12]|uniref:hypothetical protein n=1 Tax=Brachybacterium sp. GPGPB12 TaxID=3023517 RepID=UPI003134286E